MYYHIVHIVKYLLSKDHSVYKTENLFNVYKRINLYTTIIEIVIVYELRL